MTINLRYGDNVDRIFEVYNSQIMKEVKEKTFNGKTINHDFFGNESSTGPKSFYNIFSIYMPKAGLAEKRVARPPWSTDYWVVPIKQTISFSAVLGYVEGIPIIGTAIAIINALGQFILMTLADSRLRTYVNETVGGYNLKIFEEAVAYTVHQNHLTGSLLSIVPLVKPIVRIYQGAVYFLDALD